MWRLVSLSVSRSVCQSVNQSVSPSVCLSVSQSVSQSVRQAGRQSVSQSVTLSVGQLVLRWFRIYRGRRHASTEASTFSHLHRLIVGGRWTTVWTGSSIVICICSVFWRRIISSRGMNEWIISQQSVEDVNTEQKESSRAARSSNNSSAGIRRNIGESIQLFIFETPICETHQNTNLGNSLD